MHDENTLPARPFPQDLPAESRFVDGQDDAEAVGFSELLPAMLVATLERRYLADLQPQGWDIRSGNDDHFVPHLQEVTQIGRQSPEAWAAAMPRVLSTCHEPGHAVVMALHGDQNRHRLYLGARRMAGMAARHSGEYLAGQDGALKAYFTGLKLDPPRPMDDQGMPRLSGFLQTSSAMAVLTGTPSIASDLNESRGETQFQSLDRFVRAVGNQNYVLMVIAEPLESTAIDSAIDACRRLRGEIHAFTRRTVNRSRGKSESEVAAEPTPRTWRDELPSYLYGMSAFCAVAAALTPLAGLSGSILAGLGHAASTSAVGSNVFAAKNRTPQKNISNSWSESGGIELLNANAEACEQLLQTHISRLLSARSNGWWCSAVYLAAESDMALQSVSGAARSLCSGGDSSTDPMRCLTLPPHLLRPAMTAGQILSLKPASGDGRTATGHPLGEPFDRLATCVNSRELAVLLNVPAREIPGLPMRDQTEFAVSVPATTGPAVELGMLEDSTGRPLTPVSIPASVLNRHVLVVGATGYGKSNTCKTILVQAYSDLRVPFLVVEPAKTEYRRLATLAGLEGRLRVYTIGQTGGDNEPHVVPLRLNPMAWVPGIPLGRHIDLLKAVFNASFPMYAGMPYVLEEAILEVYADRGWSLHTSRNGHLSDDAGPDDRAALMPDLSDLHDKIEVVLSRKKYGQEISQNMGAALRSRVRHLMHGNKGMTLNTRRSTPFADLFRRPAVIELQNLGDDEEKAFVMALVFAQLYEWAEVRQRDIPAGASAGLQHLTLVEEAHRLLAAGRSGAGPEVGDPRAKAVAMFTDMLAEMRSYGEGFVIADQIPTKLAPETMKNSNLKICHRLMSPDDRHAAGGSMNLTDAQARHLNTLPPGMAVVHDERIGEAILVRVTEMRTPPAVHRPPGGSENSGTGVGIGGGRAYLHRNAGCHGCPRPCVFFPLLLDAMPAEELFGLSASLVDAVLLGESALGWKIWVELRERLAGLDPGDGRDRNGLLYCAATQSAHLVITRLLSVRNEVLQNKTGLTPADLIARDRACREIGRLAAAWVSADHYGTDAAAVFGDVHSKSGAVLSPRSVHRCVGDCRMFSFVPKVIQKAGKSLELLFRGSTRSDLLRRQVRDVLDPHVASVAVISRCESPTEAASELRRCVLVQLAAGSASPQIRDLILAEDGSGAG